MWRIKIPIPLIVGGGLALGALLERYGAPTPTGAVNILLTKTNVNIEQQAYNTLRLRLVEREGQRSDVYLDSLGILTVGIGHKVLPADGLKLGQRINNAQLEKFYDADATTAFNAALSQAKEIGKYNVDMIVALAEVNFQLGIYWRTKFPNTWSLLKSAKKDAAIKALLTSKWYRQTPNRVIAFTQAINRNFA